MRLLPLAAVLLLAFAVPAHARDYSAPGSAYSILIPGQTGTLPTDENSTDQADMYDALTPELGAVSAADLKRTFKPNVFGTRGQGPTRVEKTTNSRVRIVVDKWGVPHITAKRRADVMFGVGWMISKQRSLLMELARPLGRLTVLDPPGINAFNLVTSLRQFTPSAQADAIVARQLQLLERSGPKGKEMIRDMRAYLRGINAQYEASDQNIKPWTMTDLISISGFIGSIFGRGGGDEARRSLFLDALRKRLGEAQGTAVWNDLRNYSDPEAPASITNRASWITEPDTAPGSAVLDDGSFEAVQYPTAGAAPAATESPKMSNALLTAGRRSKSGRPLLVAGPQLGTYYPALVYEVDIHGGGIDARGITTPGAGPYVFIGRNQDFAWSLTSASNDITDTYVETLCGGSDTKYMYKGTCRDMTAVDAGVLKGNDSDVPDQRLTWNETVHGPVTGYATVGGQRVAVSRRRSTRNREIMSIRFAHDMNSGGVRSAKDFIKAVGQFEHTFHVLFANEKEIAMYSSCRCPTRAPGTHPALPTRGDGDYEWRGYLSRDRHPQQIKRHGVILNWNNKPAPGWGAADGEWGFGSRYRVELFPINRKRKHTLASLVGVMNDAATQDNRGLVLPSVFAVLEAVPAPNPRVAQMVEILKDWYSKDLRRLDRDLDGNEDHTGPAIFDVWWPRLGDAVMSPVLGDLVDRLATLNSRGSAPDTDGNQSTGGWLGYIDKDLRTLLGRSVKGKYNARYCGAGDLAACANSIWASLDAAAAQLETDQGTADPNAWRKSTAGARTAFAPGLIDKTLRYSNRPTFQQAISFRAGRP